MIDYDLEGRVVVGPSAQPPTLIVPPTDILPPAILVSPAVLQRARELLALTATAPSIVRDQQAHADHFSLPFLGFLVAGSCLLFLGGLGREWMKRGRALAGRLLLIGSVLVALGLFVWWGWHSLPY